MKKYQILKFVKGGDRWEFVAHGVRFNEKEALEMKTLIISHGSRVKMLPLPVNF